MSHDGVFISDVTLADLFLSMGMLLVNPFNLILDTRRAVSRSEG